MLAPCCEAEGVHVTLMQDSRLFLTVRAVLVIPGGDTVEISVMLQFNDRAITHLARRQQEFQFHCISISIHIGY